MTKSDVWMPFYISDYLDKTMHLTRDQHGGYMLLLMACWKGDGRLPRDPGQLAGIVKASAAEWRKLAPVLLPYFDDDGVYLTHRRVMKEREKAERLSAARRESGRLGGRPRKQSESEKEALGFREQKLGETPSDVARPSPAELAVPSETANISKRRRAVSLADGETASCAWRGPAEIREAFAALGDEWCRSYLDHCTWQDVPERALIPATGYAATMIKREARSILVKNNIVVLERAA